MIFMTFPKRLRYTHKIWITTNTCNVFSGSVSSVMNIVGYPTDEDFYLCFKASNVCRVKVRGSLDGESKTERLSLNENETKYTVNSFDMLLSLTSTYFENGTTLMVQAVDSAGQPIFWNQITGPWRAEFGSHSGLQSQIQANELGLGNTTIHYVRIERAAPLSKDMEFTVSGFDGRIFVPISDFENISTPPSYIPQEWAFRCVDKTMMV